jgi:hypothetical protein
MPTASCAIQTRGRSSCALYALNRPSVAGVAVYSGPDPFGALDDPCPQVPVSGEPANITEVRIFNPRLPAMHVHNSCDVAGICPNGEKLAAELRRAGVNLEDVIIDSAGKRVAACEVSCGADPKGGIDPWRNPPGWLLGLHHHERWPSQWTPAMLDFFREHPLRPAGAPF